MFSKHALLTFAAFAATGLISLGAAEGKLLQKFDKLPKQINCPVVEGDIAACKIPEGNLEKAVAMNSPQGGMLIMGAGNKEVGVTFGDELILGENQEVVFRVKRLEAGEKGGWLAYFMTAASVDNQSKVSITPRGNKNAYVSGSYPGKGFTVLADNTPVTYPAVFTLRRADGKFSATCNGKTLFESSDANFSKLERISLYIGAEKPETSGLMEISSVELREAAK